ncbi:MAG TPA: hypothetical protein VIP05_21640 [Burkholderiaceae bacterium]
MTAALRSCLHLAVAAALSAAVAAHAQSKAAAPAAAPAPAPAQAALPAPDAEKQKAIDRILAVFHPENGVLQAVQRQGLDAMQQSNIALHTAHVPKERADKTLNEIRGDVQKYIDSTMPVAVASAKKNTNPAVGPILAANFSADELRQIAALLESPLKAKFEKLIPQMENAVGQKVQADIAPQVNANTKAMTEAVSTKLQIAATAQ